ncbi:hypothetical protein D9M69_692370 [compost metagenome]
MVRSPVTTASLMSAQYERKVGPASLLRRVSKEYFTSFASTGEPSENRALGFSRKVTLKRSGASWMSSASRPYCEKGSSSLGVVSESKSRPYSENTKPLAL